MIKGDVGSQCRYFGVGEDLASVLFPLVFSDCSDELKTLSEFVTEVHCQENISVFLLET